MGRAQDKHPDRVYIGERRAEGAVVWIAWAGGGRWLRAQFRRGYWNHGDGLEWGYSGSGPAQLALEILADATQDIDRAERSHQAFKSFVIAELPRDGWSLHRAAVLSCLEFLEEREEQGKPWHPDDTVSLGAGLEGAEQLGSPCEVCEGSGVVVQLLEGAAVGREHLCPRCRGRGRA